VGADIEEVEAVEEVKEETLDNEWMLNLLMWWVHMLKVRRVQ